MREPTCVECGEGIGFRVPNHHQADALCDGCISHEPRRITVSRSTVSTTGKNGSDPLVVETSRLAAFLNGWIERYAPKVETIDTHDDQRLTPLQYLAEHSKLDPRAIARVLKNETKITTFALAEQLLCAIDRTDVIAPGNLIPVFKNPQWSMRRFLAYMRSSGDELEAFDYLGGAAS